MLSADRLQRAAGALAVLNLVAIVVLMGRPSFSNASRPQRGISDPVIALQMARDEDEVDAVLGDAPSPDREVMRIKQYADFVFIALYLALYLTLSALLAGKGRFVAIAAAVCGAAAAAFDVMENLAILRILDTDLRHTSQAMVDAIRRPSLAKWALAFVAMALLANLLLAVPHWIFRVVGAANVAAAAVGFYGLYDNASLVWAGIPMVGGLIALSVFFFFPGRRFTRMNL